MAPDTRVKDVGEIATAHLFDMVVDLNPRLNIGSGPYGRRVLFGAAGGRRRSTPRPRAPHSDRERLEADSR